MLKYLAHDGVETGDTAVEVIMRAPRQLEWLHHILVTLRIVKRREERRHGCATRWRHPKHPIRAARWGWRRGFYAGVAVSMAFLTLAQVVCHTLGLELP